MVKQYTCGIKILWTFEKQQHQIVSAQTSTDSSADAWASSGLWQSIKLLQSRSPPVATVKNSPNTAGVTAQSYHYPAAS